MREISVRELNSTRALTIIRASIKAGDDASQDEEGLYDTAGFYNKPSAIQHLMLDDSFNAISQYRIMDFLTAASFAMVNEGSMSVTNREYLGLVRNISPDGADALERDLYRIVANKKKGLELPAEGPEFEDPFRMGRHELEKLRGDSFRTDAFAKLRNFFTADPSRGLVRNIGKLPQKMSPAMQEVVMVHLRLFLDRGGNISQREATKAWYYYSGALRDVNVDAKFNFFLHLHNRMPEQQARKIFGKLLLNWFEAPEGSTNSIHTLVAAALTTAGRYLYPLIKENPLMRDNFIGLAATGRPYESTFAMKVLSECCSDPQEFKSIVTDIATKDPQLETKVFAARMLNFLCNSTEPTRAIPYLLDGILECPAVIGTVTLTDFSAGNTDIIAESLRERFPVLAAADEQSLKEAVERRLVAAAPGKELFNALEGLSLPGDPTDDEMAEEIRNFTSIPLVETRMFDLEYLLGDRFKIFIKQNPSAISSLGSWTAELRLTERDEKGEIVNEALELHFDNCKLVTDAAITEEMRPFLTTLGLIVGHKYFVRQKDTSETIPPPVKSEQGREEQSPEPELKESTESAPESEPVEEESPPSSDHGVSVVKERKEKMLTVDISSVQKERKAAAEGQIKSTLENNKSLIEALLRGETDGIDLDRVLMHQRIEGLQGGSFEYERVPAADIRKAVEDGTLIEQDWHVLNTLPHMKVVGYRVKTFRDREDGTTVLGVERCGRTELAEMAYLHYQASDLPDLSPFHEMDVSFGIVADAVYEPGHIMEVRTEDAEESFHTREIVMADTNAKLAMTMRDPKWMKIWAKSQEDAINREIDEILESDLPDDRKLEELEKRQAQLEGLSKLLIGMAKESRIRLHKTDDPESTRASVKLAMGYVLTETTFNRGNYISLQKFAKKRKIACVPDGNSGEDARNGDCESSDKEADSTGYDSDVEVN